LRLITTVSVNSETDAICLNLAMHSLSSVLLLFSSFKMMMSTLLLYMKQQAAWSHHLQLLQHSLKCFDVQQHSEKSVILCFWQLIQLSEINTLWLWIKIALMYDSWWVLICCNVIQFCTNKTIEVWPLLKQLFYSYVLN